MLGKNFIHYCDDLDALNTVLESGEISIRDASYAYDEAKRINEQKLFFAESTQDEVDVALEAAQSNVFAAIGKAVMNAVAAFKKFLEDLITFCTDKIRGAETDKDKINKILKEHPELKDQIVLSLQSGELSYKDIATFEKDYLGLLQLFDSGKIDEPTFKSKAQSVIEKFEKSAKPILAASVTVVGLIAILPNLVTAVGNAKNSIVRVNHALDKINTEIDKNQVADQGKLRATANALRTYIGLTSKEYKNQKTFTDKATGRLAWLSKTAPGQWFARKQADSQNAAYGRVKAKEDKANKEAADAKDKKDKEAQEEAARRAVIKQSEANVDIDKVSKMNRSKVDAEKDIAAHRSSVNKSRQETETAIQAARARAEKDISDSRASSSERKAKADTSVLSAKEREHQKRAEAEASITASRNNAATTRTTEQLKMDKSKKDTHDHVNAWRNKK